MSLRALKSLALLFTREAGILPLLLPLRASHSRTLYGKDRWEKEYSSGEWDFLGSLAEAAHYHVICSYLQALKPGGAILDVGCGEGLLAPVLKPYGYRRYLGIDIAETAIAKAMKYADANTAFRAGSGDNLPLTEKFDAIIFNETLYYFASPKDVLAHYRQFLNPGGVFIISMALSGLRDGLLKLKIWRDIAPAHKTLDEICLYTPDSATWIIRALCPKER